MKRIAVLLVAIVSGGAPVTAQAARFEIASETPGNLVRFVSKAPMESFDGKTSKISGWLTLDPAALPESLEIDLTVDLASLDTGIALRNRHMCENHLHTSEFPVATFRGGVLKEGAGSDLTSGGAHKALLAGEMDLHGVKRTIELPLWLTYDSATSKLKLSSEFGIALSDYNIPRPKFLVMKLGDVQKVTVELSATQVE